MIICYYYTSNVEEAHRSGVSYRRLTVDPEAGGSCVKLGAIVKTVTLVYLFPVTMEEVQQGSNGTETAISTLLTSSQFSQIAQQVTHRSLFKTP